MTGDQKRQLRRLRRTAMVLTLAFIAAACGSSAREPDTGLGGDGSGPAVSLPEDGGTPWAEGPDGESWNDEGQPGEALAQGGGDPSDPAQSDPAQPDPAGPGAPQPGPGPREANPPPTTQQQPQQQGSAPLCSGTVQLGIMYMDPDDTNAAGGAIGAQSNATVGLAEFEDVLDRFNEAGGLAGCQVEPVWYAFRPTGDWVRQAEQACARFTEDHDVFAAIIAVHITGRSLMDCLTRRGVVQYWPRTVVFMLTDEDYRQNAGSMYRPDDISIDRKAFIVDELRDTGYFDPGARVGLVSMEDGTSAPQHLVDNVLKPRLSQHGVNVVAEGSFRQVRSLAELNRMAQDASQLVLRFRTANVTHVFFTGGGGSFMFLNVAENQGYRPRYALTSDEDLASTNNHPAAQHARSVAISWQPVFDAHAPDWPQNPAQQRCTEKYGIELGRGRPQIGLCDGLEFLSAGLSRAPEMSQAGFHAGVQALGTGFTSAIGFGPTRFGPGRYDGGVAAAPMTFDPQTHSFRYSGAPRSVR